MLDKCVSTKQVGGMLCHNSMYIILLGGILPLSVIIKVRAWDPELELFER